MENLKSAFSVMPHLISKIRNIEEPTCSNFTKQLSHQGRLVK